MGMWQQIALAALAVGVIFLFGPAAKRTAENSPSGAKEDWWTFVRILAAVVGLIVLMILFLRM